MKLTIYGEDGRLQGHKDLPDEAVELNTQDVFGYVLGHYDPKTQYFDFVSESIVDMPTKPSDWHVFDFETKQWIDTAPDHIEEIKATAINKVNQTIGQIRSTFVTVLPAQDMVYQQKEAEAIAYLNDPASEPDLNNYPFIAAEVGITAPTASEVAQVYVNLAYQLRVVAAGLEQIRLGAVAAIESAADQAGIDAAVLYFETAIASLA